MTFTFEKMQLLSFNFLMKKSFHEKVGGKKKLMKTWEKNLSNERGWKFINLFDALSVKLDTNWPDIIGLKGTFIDYVMKGGI